MPMAINAPPRLLPLATLLRWEETRDQYLRRAATLEQKGDLAAANEARGTAAFIEDEMGAAMDPVALRNEAANLSARATREPNAERAAEIRARGDRIGDLLHRCELAAARRAAANADFSWIRPVLGGARGESVLDS